VQLVWGWSPAQAALGNLPQVVVMIAIDPFVEKFVDKLGTHRAGVLGASSFVAGLLIYGVLGRQDYPWIAIALALTAGGMRVVATTAGVHTFENAVTTATPALTALCAALIGWAALRSAEIPAPAPTGE
jgi:hypothetical protein